MYWRNLLASIFGDFCGGSNCPGVTPTIPAKKADAREFQDCYCARIGVCWLPDLCQLPLGFKGRGGQHVQHMGLRLDLEVGIVTPFIRVSDFNAQPIKLL